MFEAMGAEVGNFDLEKMEKTVKKGASGEREAAL
jgi:hypothetical protein